MEFWFFVYMFPYKEKKMSTFSISAPQNESHQHIELQKGSKRKHFCLLYGKSIKRNQTFKLWDIVTAHAHCGCYQTSLDYNFIPMQLTVSCNSSFCSFFRVVFVGMIQIPGREILKFDIFIFIRKHIDKKQKSSGIISKQLNFGLLSKIQSW